MNQTIKKIKIEDVSEREAMESISKGISKLESATFEQLQASLVGLAETFVGMTTECDQKTAYALVMEVVANTLDENADALSMPSHEQIN